MIPNPMVHSACAGSQQAFSLLGLACAHAKKLGCIEDSKQSQLALSHLGCHRVRNEGLPAPDQAAQTGTGMPERARPCTSGWRASCARSARSGQPATGRRPSRASPGRASGARRTTTAARPLWRLFRLHWSFACRPGRPMGKRYGPCVEIGLAAGPGCTCMSGCATMPAMYCCCQRGVHSFQCSTLDGVCGLHIMRCF